MKDLYQSKYLDEILFRINKLSPDSQRLWKDECKSNAGSLFIIYGSRIRR